MFTPENRVGPTLGYHVFDVYRFDPDSLNYYNTNKPYSAFTYRLGSKLEQIAGITHTQNVKPNWNFYVAYRKINSPGFYNIQRTNHDNLNITTNYKSLDKHYAIYSGLVYNKEQNDENGGIADATQLDSAIYADRKTLRTPYQSGQYSSSRSSVNNVLRDFTFLFQHGYTWGRTDTVYNEDSTQSEYHLKPLFSVVHKMEIGSEKHMYKDLTPDSVRYIALFAHPFLNRNTGYYAAGGDSVFTSQKWFHVDNKVLLNGFIGKEGRQLQFNAGLGNRFDRFTSQQVITTSQVYAPTGYVSFYHTTPDRNSIVSNYLTGELKKEALQPGAWEYKAATQFYFTGQYAGNFVLQASLGKELQKAQGSFIAGVKQALNSAPYSYTNYENAYTRNFYSFNTESVSRFYASVDSRKWLLSGGVNSYLVNNYIYINESRMPAQYTVPFSLSQAWVRKVFRAGHFYLDNELIYQQVPGSAPVNIPALMGRNQFSYEGNMFKNALKVAVGVQVRYNSSYAPAGYDAQLNRFYYQSKRTVANTPEGAVFANMRIKRFRGFIMADNLQQLFATNAILFVGNAYGPINSSGSNLPVYAAPDLVIRFGFNWVMIN